MTASNRADIIAESIWRAGRKGQNLSLVNAFDAVLIDISIRYPLLGSVENSQNLAANTAYVTLPSDFSQREFFALTGNNSAVLQWEEPQDYFSYIKGNPAANTTNPTNYTIDRTASKIYVRPTPPSNLTASFFYAKIHPKSSNNAYTHILGEEFDEVITLGVTAKACQIIQEYEKASYWWGNPQGPAPGSYLYDLAIKAGARLEKHPGVNVLKPDKKG